MGQTIDILNFRRSNLALFSGIFTTFLLLVPAFLSAQLTVNITRTNVSCFGGSNGSASASATGGVTPYSFVWSNGQSTATITNLPAGTYTVTATGANGATASASTSVTAPPQLGVTAFGESQICDLVPDGKATAVPFGGTPPYTYLWNNGQTTAQILHLPQGTYTVTVTDNNGCTAVASATVFFWDEGLWVTDTIFSTISCFGANDAVIGAIAMSGTPPYTFVWSNGVTATTSMTHQLFNIGPGSYTVTVTDANGCSHTPPPIVVTQPLQLQISKSSTPASCGASNGSATVTPSGGTPPYTVLWSNGSTSFTIFNLAAGTYTATVRDSRLCAKAESVTVGTSGGNLQLSAGVVAAASCNTGGSASVNVTGGGVGPFTYLWDNGQTTQTATNLSVGNHTVTVVDMGTGCSGTATVNIPQTGAPTVTATVTQQATCTTGGSATANVSGGTPPYTFKWDNNQMTQTATNLSVGTHSVTVTDGGGCVAIANVLITAPQGPSVSVSVVTNATCTTGGSATATATGGSGGYVYLWDNGQTTQTATNLSAGNHTVTVTDSNGCAATGNVTIGQTQGPTASAVQVTPATCLTGGSATASATGGTLPYTFKWDNNQMTATAINLSVGIHSVTVTDANGCASVATVNITKTPSPTVLATPTSPATCIAGGTATAQGVGGTPPYTYKWSNNQMTQNATNLPAGIHSVTVTDANGCTGTANVTISGVPSPMATITASSNATCDAQGTATVLASGGAPPYSYKWDNNEMTPTAINLSAGSHTVTVTDANGCTATASVNIGQTNNGIKIGDYVWYDYDQDGFQHPSETDGVNNITVMLIKPGPDGAFGTSDDITVKTTTTNNLGKYEFSCVTPGTYILMFSGLPAGYEWTDKDKVANDCNDSDVKANGKTDPFIIVAGQPNNFCFDAGIHVFCDNVTMAGTVCCDQVICEGDTPAPLYSVMPAGGGSGQLQYLWLQLINQGPAGPQWVGIPGATGPDLTLGPLFVTSYFMRCARRAGCVNFLESNIVTITVKPAGSPGCGPFTMDFTATNMKNNSVKVDWTTRPEATAYMYSVQHSTDKATWHLVKTMMGLQDATNPNHYEVMHETPSAGKNYYRIMREDANSNLAYSEVVELALEVEPAESVSITPNPVFDLLTVKNLLVLDSDIQIQISATNGDVLHTLEIPAGSVQKLELPMKALPTGIYIARVRFGGSTVKTLKLLKL